MAFPPTVGTSYQDRGGRKWTVTAVVESGIEQGVSMSPHASEGRSTVDKTVIIEEFDDWEAKVRSIPT